MTESSVENKVCRACGADVREGALFCYNCGKSVQPAVESKDEKSGENVSEIWFREKIAPENGNGQKPEIEEIKIEEAFVAQQETASVKTERKTARQKQNELKTAASMRRKPKVLPKKKVEIVWEENDNYANGWFVLAAIILTILAGVVVYLALYLK